MANQEFMRAIFLGGLAALFLVGALHLPIGQLSRPGPGLFPIIVSLMLLTVALLMIVRAQCADAARTQFNAKNITIIICALISFVTCARLINISCSIISLVFIASIASKNRSLVRSAGISGVLILIALAFQKFLGLNLQVV